jgi:hypothetical protein
MRFLGTVALMMLGCSEQQAGNVEGGMDGGGQLGLGLTWSTRVFVQELWEESGVSFVGMNQRSEAVRLEVFDFDCSGDAAVGDSCRVGDKLAEWEVPANGSRAVDVNALISEQQGLVALRANGENLGTIERPRQPRATVLPVVSNQGLNGGFVEGAQVETESATVGSTFRATISLSRPGELAFVSAPADLESVQFARIVGAHSGDADVVETATGFHVVLPSDTSQERPIRVELELAMPDDFAGGPLLGLDGGHYCFEGTSSNCGRGAGITRALLVP